ncbi:hypothetical protein CSKR_201020 [Clonorchis sinensis]|uniref:Uncharacterized protein n=1 Tax=Clonorchis sinensis TaxID=79923 RepID=A0A8T1MJV4_CLOSI|nr:hypothetical protein CSKR_201020 [Clonorchis sinensis]
MFWGQEFCSVLFACLVLAVDSSNEAKNISIDVRGKVYMTGVELPWSDDLANKTSDIYKGLEEHLCYTEQVSFYVNITLLNAWSACKLTDVYKGSVIATTRVWFDLGRLEESQVQTDSSRFLDSLKMLLEAYKKHIDPNVAYYGEVIYVRAIARQATQCVRVLSFLLLAVCGHLLW